MTCRDGPVLAAGIHPLKNKQQRIALGRIVKLLQRTQFGNVCFQEFLISFLRFAKKASPEPATF
jgi:hypothetical protein